MRVFVTGVGGQLGHDVMNELEKRGYEGIGSDITPEYGGADDGTAVTVMPYAKLDITDFSEVERVIIPAAPDAVIHCAAWTDVDRAEEDCNIEKVRAVNADGTANIAKVCRKLDCKMLYVSTDYLFGGQGTDPWKPDCRNYRPLNVYGLTKLEGEVAVSVLLDKYFIVRTEWLFGMNEKNFVQKMLKAGQTGSSLRVICDQIGTPTYTFDLARLLVDMIETDRYGYYHATNEGGYISWYDFTCEIYRQAGLKADIIPVSTEEYGLSRAKRPCNSRFDREKLSAAGFEPLPVWQEALSRYLNKCIDMRRKQNGTD